MEIKCLLGLHAREVFQWYSYLAKAVKPRFDSFPVAASWHLSKLQAACPIPPCECLVRICQRPNPYLAFFPWQLYTLALGWWITRHTETHSILHHSGESFVLFGIPSFSNQNLTSQSVEQGCPIFGIPSVTALYLAVFDNGSEFCQHGKWSVPTININTGHVVVVS